MQQNTGSRSTVLTAAPSDLDIFDRRYLTYSVHTAHVFTDIHLHKVKKLEKLN